jgi:hypothetical protein
MTVPLCPDRYTASDTKTHANQVVLCVAFVATQPKGFGKHCGVSEE